MNETEIEHPDEILRRIYYLERYREYPMNADDENQLLDILKLIMERVIKLESPRATRQ